MSKKVFVDSENITVNMTLEEKFKFLQELGYINKNEKLEDWIFTQYEVENREDEK